MSRSRVLSLLSGRSPAGSRDDSSVPPISVEFQDGLSLAFAIVDEKVKTFSDLVVNPRTGPGLWTAAKLDAILMVGLLEITVDAQHRFSGMKWASGNK